MKNISFDNPFWLLIAIPLLIGVLVPFFIAIRKENRSRSVIISLIIHLVIIVLIGLAAAKTLVTTVVTKTEIIVVADVSYSSRDNKDQINAYISEIEKKMPENSKIGVVLFAKDQKLHTPLGGQLTPVNDEGLDTSATDIAAALDYASGLFSGDVLKRVVLMTDAAETVSDDVSRMVAAVEKLSSQNISIDAIYLDSNIKQGVKDVQITGVEYSPATYINHESVARVLVQSNTEEAAKLSVYMNGEPLSEKLLILSQGYNVVNVDLSTSEAGSYEYEFKLDPVSGDATPQNNIYSLTQSISSELKMLLVTSTHTDIPVVAEMIGKDAKLDIVYIPASSASMSNEDVEKRYNRLVKAGRAEFIDPESIPCSISALTAYDEFMLSNVDPRQINNITAFIESIETVVSMHGKRLVTVGDMKIQNKTDDTLKSLEDMLPVKYGNSSQDPRLYAIVIDISRSMYDTSQFQMAKTAAIYLLQLLSNDDEVIVVAFAGDIYVVQSTTKAANRDEIAATINALQPEQGTSIGGGLGKAVEMMIGYDNELKEVMLISDGKNFTGEAVTLYKDTPKEITFEDDSKTALENLASYMCENGINVSTMNVQERDDSAIQTLEAIANEGGGNYYYINGLNNIKDLVFSSVADDLTETVIDGRETSVNIKLPDEDVLDGIYSLPKIYGYVQSKAKSSSTTVLTVDYEKPSGVLVEVPLYAYWTYGNGMVASFTSTLSGDWVEYWQDGSGERFFSNVASEAIPEEKNSNPYFINTSYDGVYSNIEIIPSESKIAAYASMNVTITYPNGETVTEKLTFDSSRYFHSFETPELGKYGIAVEYITNVGSTEKVYTSETAFHISYSPEYDTFSGFDPSPLHAAIRHRGTVSENSIPALTSPDDEIAYYELSLTVPLLAAAVALFVIDIIIRKIKLSDIKRSFKKKKTSSEIIKEVEVKK